MTSQSLYWIKPLCSVLWILYEMEIASTKHIIFQLSDIYNDNSYTN